MGFQRSGFNSLITDRHPVTLGMSLTFSVPICNMRITTLPCLTGAGVKINVLMRCSDTTAVGTDKYFGQLELKKEKVGWTGNGLRLEV